jgi:hypothetical protein
MTTTIESEQQAADRKGPTSIRIREELLPRLEQYCRREKRAVNFAANEALDQFLPPLDEG